MDEYEQDRIQDIYMHLKNKGFDVYFPAQHQGECISPYVVVKGDSDVQFQRFSTTSHYYDLLCYVPKDNYSTLYPFVDSVKAAMKELETKIMIRPAYYDTSSYYDEAIKGHMVSIQYINYRKL